MTKEEQEDFNFYIGFNIKYRALFGVYSYLINGEEKEKYYCRLCNKLILTETKDEFDDLLEDLLSEKAPVLKRLSKK